MRLLPKMVIGRDRRKTRSSLGIMRLELHMLDLTLLVVHCVDLSGLRCARDW